MRILPILLFFLAIRLAFGQTVILPDTNLRNKLIASYPQVMQGNVLNVSKAAALTGTLDIRNANIADATGVQYFTSIITLDMTNNQIAIMPDISAITGLQHFYATQNELSSLPSMAALTNLVDFQVMYNQLSVLPDLSGAKGLLFLYCANNNISQLPPLNQFPLLSILDAGYNPIGNSIDVSSCINLTQLHIHETGMDTIIGLGNLKKLTTLYAWSNNITSFKALDSITTITICDIFDNPITGLPYLQNKPNLNTLIVYNCQLTFEDIQPILQYNPPATFTYTPQRAIPFGNITARAGNPDTLTYPVISPLSSNIYVWLKNSIVFDSSSSPSYVFNPLASTNAGTYQLKVYNTTIPTLVLNTNTFTISVLNCVDLSIPSLDVINKDCSKGYTLDFSANQISGGTPPFTYEISTSATRKTINYPIVQNLEPGNYFLTVIDSKNCKSTDNFTLNNLENCDPVITPNGDGIMDTYFIENSGKVSVYDLNRNLVNTLQAPVVWNGTDRNGTLLDAGLYILTMDGQKTLYISIIR